MARTPFVIQSKLAPNAVADSLRNSIDEKHRTLFSMSGYRGNCPFLGEVRENTFTVQKRKFYRNDFAGRLYARFEPDLAGTRIEGYFDSPRWALLFMRVWLILAVLVGGPLFVRTMLDVLIDARYIGGDRWVGLLVPPASIAFGTILPKVGRLLGKNDERFILETLQRKLAALATRIEDAV